MIPTLLAWDESAVIYDIKGENWAKTAGFRASRGQLCFKFSPVEEATSSRFNPLAEVRLFTPRDVSDAQNIADMIIRSGEDSPMERHWEDSAASLTTGMILHACYTAAAEDRVACLADLAGLFTRPGVEFRETLNEMVSYPHDTEYRHGWRTPAGLKTSTHPVVSEKAQEMLDKESKELSGVLSTAKTALALYSDPLVARNTAASDFTINDLVNDDRPVSLYLVVPPSDKIRLRRLIRLMFTMVVNRLTERMAFDGSEQKEKQTSPAIPDRRIPQLKSDGNLRRRTVLHGRVWAESLFDHPGHPPDRGRLWAERKHRFELPRSHCFRTQPGRNCGIAFQDDRHGHGAEGQFQLLGLPILSGDVSRERERGSHRAAADDAGRDHAAQAPEEGGQR